MDERDKYGLGKYHRNYGLHPPSGLSRGDVIEDKHGKMGIVLRPDISICIAHWGESRPGCVALFGTSVDWFKYNELKRDGRFWKSDDC